MKYIAYLIIPLVLVWLYGGCGSGGGSINVDQVTLDNLCFLLTSNDPCFDSNEGSETRMVDDKTVEEVIAEEEGKPTFIKQLEFSKILSTLGRSIFLPTLREGCMWDDDGLVIKTTNDWDNYRNNCYFTDSFFDPPDVDFSESMVIVSLQNSQGFGTDILAVLEFEDELIAIISDRTSDVASQLAPGFGLFVIEIERQELPVSFIRIRDLCNSFLNLSNSECLGESMTNICEPMFCSFLGNGTGLGEGDCLALDCTSINCNRVPGTITDLSLNENDFPIGLINIEGEDEEVSCSLIVE